MKIQNKLFLFLFSFSLVLVTVLVSLMQWSIDKGMVEYVISKEVETLQPVLTQLTDEYKIENNWLSMAGKHRRFHKLISQQLADTDFDIEKNSQPANDDRKPFIKPSFQPHQPENRPPPRHNSLDKFPPRPPKGDAHYALLNINETLIAGIYLPTLEYTKISLKVDESVVGFFAISKRNQLTQGYEVDFIEQQQEYLWLIAFLMMSLVALVTFPIARHIVEPIKLITRGMHKLTQGDYQQSIQVNRNDELSELSRDFNELALTLAKNENARKRWLANISHELRTPVAILRGELEAMLDKVRPLTHNNIASANDEVKHLQCLIDDLNQLTSTDIGGMGYRKQHEDLVQLIKSEAGKYRGYLSDANIALLLELNAKEVMIYADKTRLYQLFENLINNCIKYAKASEFKVSVIVNKLAENSAGNDKGTVTLRFEDNGIGVDEQHLIHLFEYLYRVEDSRNRETGGFGLGLSICQHIVIAHQGEISAEKSVLGGLAIIITLPLA
ncbi:two-component sensor histidine kinase [Colwellia sp. PAMC 21821]|nr:two-component sensor histidine kinase [Colwellia sp. PAMC 21821]